MVLSTGDRQTICGILAFLTYLSMVTDTVNKRTSKTLNSIQLLIEFALNNRRPETFGK